MVKLECILSSVTETVVQVNPLFKAVIAILTVMIFPLSLTVTPTTNIHRPVNHNFLWSQIDYAELI